MWGRWSGCMDEDSHVRIRTVMYGDGVGVGIRSVMEG